MCCIITVCAILFIVVDCKWLFVNMSYIFGLLYVLYYSITVCAILLLYFVLLNHILNVFAWINTFQAVLD